MFLPKVFKALNQKKVRYLVVGGVASIFYGNPRFTMDLDLWVDPDENNLTRLVKAFNALHFKPRIPVKAEEFISLDNRKRWRKEKGMLAFTFLNPKNPLENVDILCEGPVAFEKAYRHKSIFKAERLSIPTISRDYLIIMKERAGREQDKQDVRILKSLRKNK